MPHSTPISFNFAKVPDPTQLANNSDDFNRCKLGTVTTRINYERAKVIARPLLGELFAEQLFCGE